MIVFRLSKQTYCRDLSGTGAFKAGGRWNSKGTALIYTGESRALCMAEVAVHVPMGLVPKDYFLATIAIPDTSIIAVEPDTLPEDWNLFPHPVSTQLIGDIFVQDRKALALKVPSVVVPGDFNYLINPEHELMSAVSLVGDPVLFPFDTRLFKPNF